MTQKAAEGLVYGIYLAVEGESIPPAVITVGQINPGTVAQVTMLGTTGDLEWEATGDGLKVRIPEAIRQNPPCNGAWALRIAFK